MRVTEKLIGMTLEDGEKFAYEEDYFIRVVSRDGKSYGITDDYRMDRINVYIQEDIILKASIG